MNEMMDSLLAVDEPAPVTVYDDSGSSPFLFVADHAHNSISALARSARRSGDRIKTPHRLGHRHRRGLS
jgi:hypothetical protein